VIYNINGLQCMIQKDPIAHHVLYVTVVGMFSYKVWLNQVNLLLL
jgi:hypothetical protein